jgi:SnoaL-like domain
MAELTDATIADRLAIQDDVFLPDAQIDYTAVGGIRGAFPEIKAWLETALGSYDVSQHMITNHDIQIAGDTATSRVYVFNPMGKRREDGQLALFFMGGYYVDRLVRTPRGWRIAQRTEELSWSDRHLR